MKAFINGLEVPFKDLGEPVVTFEGEEYNVVTDQTGAPYIQVGDTTAYLEMRDEEGNDITPGKDDEEAEPEAEVAQVAVKPVDKKVKEEKKDAFTLAIEAHLNARAQQDELFAVTLAKPNKSLKECVNYIYSEVKKTGRQGFTDAEVYGMAVHYYDEDEIKVSGSVTKPHTVVNTAIAAPAPVELSAEEKEKARQMAVDNAIRKEADRLAAKKKAAATKPTDSQPTLF